MERKLAEWEEEHGNASHFSLYYSTRGTENVVKIVSRHGAHVEVQDILFGHRIVTNILSLRALTDMEVIACSSREDP